MAWQLWHFTSMLSRARPVSRVCRVPRAARRSCSAIAPSVLSSAADTVPQKPQIRACLPGSQVACAPHAGQAYLGLAVTSAIVVAENVGWLGVQERVECGAGDPELRADLLGLQVAGLDAGEHIRLRDAHELR